MKKIYILLISFSLIAVNNFAQTSMQASLGPGTTPTTVNIYMKAIRPGTPGAISETISSLDFNIGVPAQDYAIAPTLTVLSNVFGIDWIVEEPYSEGGYWNYHILKVPEITYTFTTDLETQVMVLQLTAGLPAPIASPLNVSLVTLTNGGSKESAVFYCTGTINSVGNKGLYYARPAQGGYQTTVTNAFSYRPLTINSTLGDAPSFATIVTGTTPVKFTGFNAIKKDNNAILTWQIENESAITDRYEIERSLNGTDFKKAYSVPAKNNGNSSNTYELTDANLSSIRSAGVFYYRIRQVDKDGRIALTEVKSVRLTTKGIVIGVYPNPIKSFANLSIDVEQNADAVVTLHDASGKLVRNTQMQLFKGPNTKKINMESLAAGSYMLRIQTATETTTISLVKAN